jgi:hypothetical protein
MSRPVINSQWKCNRSKVETTIQDILFQRMRAPQKSQLFCLRVKVKFPQCLRNYASRHEDIWQECGYSSTILNISTWWGEWSGSPPGKQPTVPTVQEAGYAPEAVWALRRRESLSPLPRIEPWLLCLHSLSWSLYRLSYRARCLRVR